MAVIFTYECWIPDPQLKTDLSRNLILDDVIS